MPDAPWLNFVSPVKRGVAGLFMFFDFLSIGAVYFHILCSEFFQLNLTAFCSHWFEWKNTKSTVTQTYVSMFVSFNKDKLFVHWKNIQTDDRFPRLKEGLQNLGGANKWWSTAVFQWFLMVFVRFVNGRVS